MSTAGQRVRRSDSQQTRRALFAAMNVLVREHGLNFKLADLAREAGVGTATVYRHFNSVQELSRELHREIHEELSEEFEELAAELAGLDLFFAICQRWVMSSTAWGEAASYIRSGEGFLHQLHRGVSMVGRFEKSPDAAVSGLIDEGVIPQQDHEYALLMWVTMFDERAVFDLRATLGWDDGRIVKALSHHVLAVLTSSVERYAF